MYSCTVMTPTPIFQTILPLATSNRQLFILPISEELEIIFRMKTNWYILVVHVLHLSPRQPTHHICKVVQCKGNITLLHSQEHSNRCTEAPAVPLLLNHGFYKLENTSDREHSSNLHSLLALEIFSSAFCGVSLWNL